MQGPQQIFQFFFKAFKSFINVSLKRISKIKKGKIGNIYKVIDSKNVNKEAV